SFELGAAIRRYPRSADVCWAQEEPANQGAWTFIRPLVAELLGASRRLRYIGRDEAASPATGNHKIHQIEERAILDRAFGELEGRAVSPGAESRQAAS